MKTRIIQATNNDMNWGKFFVGQFDTDEWMVPCAYPEGTENPSVMAARGMHQHQYMVVDLETKEGGIFDLGGMPVIDLDTKHQVWVCPMYSPFLGWLSDQYKEWLLRNDGRSYSLFMDNLPPSVNLPDAEFSMAGYRRRGVTAP